MTHESAGWIAVVFAVAALLLLNGCSDRIRCIDDAAFEAFGPTLVTDANGQLYVISRDGCTGRAARLNQKLEAK